MWWTFIILMWIWLSTSSQRVLYTIFRISMICGSCWACMCVVDWRIQSVCSLDVSISYTWPTEQLTDCYSDSTYTLSSHLNHHDTLPANIIDMVIGILATQHGLSSVDTLWGMVSMEGICMWGWVRVLSGKDEIWVARLDSHESDGRSASFLSVSDPMLCRYYWWCNCDMLQYTVAVAVNWNMHYQHRAVDLQPHLCYGHLNIITVDLSHHPSFPGTPGTTIALAHLQPANTQQHHLGLWQWNYFTTIQAEELVNLHCVNQLVGRVKSISQADRTYIIDTGTAASRVTSVWGVIWWECIDPKKKEGNDDRGLELLLICKKPLDILGPNKDSMTRPSAGLLWCLYMLCCL